MQFIINGGKQLNGNISISGAKNGAFPLIAGAILTGQRVTLNNIPDIRDVHNILELVRALGIQTDFENHTLKLYAGQLSSHELRRDISKRMRASIELTAPVLARLGIVAFPHPGGCVIGERPIDLFIEGYKKTGATSSVMEGMHTLKIKRPKPI